MSAHTELVADWEGRVRAMLAGSVQPGLARAGVRVLGAGMDSVAVSVTDAVGEYIVRMPKGEDGVESIAREARLLPELGAAVSIPIPRYEFTAPNPLGPGECCVYPAVPGESLTDEDWYERGLLEQADTVRTVARFLDEVHAFPAARALELGVELRDMRTEFAEDLDSVLAQVIPVLPSDAGRRLVEVWEGYLGEDTNFDYSLVLIHADVSLDHLLISGERITGIIDFGDVQIGDPDYDLCYLWPDAGPEFVRRVQDCRGLPLDERLTRKLDFWVCSDSAIDILHAVEHDLPEFLDESVQRVCEALKRFDQTGSV
ncbi:phosphotransferase [Nocardia sp. SYP-A9097]|uniref:phosphotransferase family protein n=1 Tax=Nocardia sp. SYP-A9097 TaxID=2663237 RepID=UPI00129AC7F4|nr:phosphotransferase [Nocardia sp. SYP-A9097]MRH86854.1 phosphotransferase [Nocardia sp. SYP-A9097]